MALWPISQKCPTLAPFPSRGEAPTLVGSGECGALVLGSALRIGMYKERRGHETAALFPYLYSVGYSMPVLNICESSSMSRRISVCSPAIPPTA